MSSVLHQVIDGGACSFAQVTVTDHTGPVPAVPWDGDTWGMSSSGFVRLFALLLVLTAILSGLVRWRLDGRRPWSLRRAEEALSPAELSCLANGPQLVAVTTVWDLWRTGVLVGDNAALEAVVAAAPVVDAALLDSSAYARAAGATRLWLASEGPHRSLDGVAEAAVAIAAQGPVRPGVLSRQLRQSAAMHDLEAGLQRQGYLRTAAVRRRMGTGVAVVFAPLLAVLVARVAVGLQHGEAVGDLVVLATAAFVAFGVQMLVAERPAAVNRLVRRCCRNQLRAEAALIASLRSAVPSVDEARAVAVLGPGVLWHANPVGAATLQVPTVMLIGGTRVSMDGSLRVGGGPYVGVTTGG